MVCSQLSWRTDCYPRRIQFELLAGCEAVRALASSTRNLESGNLFFLTKILPSRICLHTCNNSGVQLLGMAFGRCRMRAKFCGPEALPLASPRTFAQVLRTLQPANWALKIDVTLLHVDGRITYHKEIGLGRLLPSWLQDYVLFFQVDRRELWWSYTKVFYRPHSDGSRLPVSPRTFCACFWHITTAKFNSKDWCYTLAFWWNDHESERNWTWTPFTQQVGFKMIFLLFNSKLTGVSSDGVRPGPSTGHTLMGLHCIDWILKQNLRIWSQSPEQKLCYKARWFYGMVTSRPFTYLEPSIAARSSGVSFNMIEQNCKNPCSCITKLIPWAKWNVTYHVCWFPNYVWTDLATSTNTLISDSQESQILQKSVCRSHMILGLTHLCLYAKTKNVCMRTWKRESMYLRK